MNIDFSNSEIILIYGYFKDKVAELETLKHIAGNPISKSDINKEIKLYTSIIKKLLASSPGLEKLYK